MPRPVQLHTFDRNAARAWRDYARYIARAASIGDPLMSLAALREAAQAVTDSTRITPARMVVHALDSADAGEPFRPYSEFFARR